MFRLAHISDLHLGPLPKPSLRQLFSKRLLGYINWKHNRENSFTNLFLNSILNDIVRQQPDHIALTGDLVNIALPEEFENARAWLKNFAKPENLSVVLGNHDAYVPGALSKAHEAFAPYLFGDNQKIQNHIYFPYLRKRGPIAIIGCSSANATAPFMATGFFSKAQADRMAAVLRASQGQVRVVLIHHPPVPKAAPYHKRMIGANDFRRVITEVGAELVLHGHTHVNSFYEIQGPQYPVPVIGVASACQGIGSVRPAASYNLISVHQDANKWNIQFERFSVINNDGTVASICEPTKLS